MTAAPAAGNRLRAWAGAGLVVVLAAAAALAVAGQGEPSPLPPRAEAERPPLLLLTSLPLVFPEDFTLSGGGSPALTALETRYKVQPIGVADAESLKGARLLLMAHPKAQPAEALVELDAWVRDGGRLVLLADPKLDWPSDRPLGDKMRPPPYFADTGLLRHWGLNLYAPETDGSASADVRGRHVELASPGRLEGNCDVDNGGLIARCAVGRGEATVIADADFLNAEDPRGGNLQMLIAELERIER